MERYRAIYVWKILEGISPNCGIEETFSERRGREVKVRPVKGKGAIQSIREKSFQIHGAKIFNILPKSIRNLKTSTEDFKAKLDKFLETIPDEPKLPGYIPTGCNQNSAGPSNSILDQSRNLRCRRPGWNDICRGTFYPPLLKIWFDLIVDTKYWLRQIQYC